jgi:hypothetical protein
LHALSTRTDADLAQLGVLLIEKLHAPGPVEKATATATVATMQNPSSPKLLASTDRAFSLVVEGYIHMGVVCYCRGREIFTASISASQSVK